MHLAAACLHLPWHWHKADPSKKIEFSSTNLTKLIAQEHISEAAVAQLGEQRTLRLHAFTCQGFAGPDAEGQGPDDRDPAVPSDTAQDIGDTIQDAVARAKAQVSTGSFRAVQPSQIPRGPHPLT